MSDPDDTNSSRDSTPQAHFHTPDSSPPPPAPLRPAPINNILKISKSKGPHVLMKDYGRVEGDYFQTFEDSFNALGVAYWRPPINDLTIPRTPEQDRAIVRVVVEAFKDMTYALDTPDNAYRKRFTPGTNVCYAGWTIEACAWMVVRMTKDIHIYGFSAPIYDVEILKAIGQTENWTFQDRIDMICFAIKVSKSVAVTLMKHEKVWTTIGAPHKLYNSAHVNNTSNAQRNRWVREGRQAEKEPNKKRPRTNESSMCSTGAESSIAGPSSSSSPTSPASPSFSPFTSIVTDNAKADMLHGMANPQLKTTNSSKINTKTNTTAQNKGKGKATVTQETSEGKSKGKATTTNQIPHQAKAKTNIHVTSFESRTADATTFSDGDDFHRSKINRKSNKVTGQAKGTLIFRHYSPQEVKATSTETAMADAPAATSMSAAFVEDDVKMSDAATARPTADVEAAHALLGFGFAGRVA